MLALELDQCRDRGDRPAPEWARDRDRDEECCECAGEITPSGGLLSDLGGEGEGVRELCAVLGWLPREVFEAMVVRPSPPVTVAPGRAAHIGKGDTLRPAM